MLQLWTNQSAEWQLNFKAQKEGETGGKFLELTTGVGKNGEQVLTVGLGDKKDFTTIAARRAIAHGINEVRKLSAQSAIADIAGMKSILGELTLSVVTEGARLALYKQENWKSKDTPKDFTLYLKAENEAYAEDKFATALALAEAVSFSRDLVNKPPNKLTPEIMVNTMAAEAAKVGIESEILDAKTMESLGMGSLLAVGNSSANEPKLLTMTYTGNPGSKEVLALVGKGVTFDTGGYSLKNSTAMLGMQGDMGGAAAVCGAICAVAAKKFKINVIAVVPAVENRISPDSFLPGDVLTSMSGKTIEISNTDAEGRLILVDAITYAIQKKGATKVVDIATLTGAVVTMLGRTTAGLLTNNDEFYETFMQAAQNGGEQYWRLPSFPEYRRMIDSTVADLHNMSSDGCGTITAGLFIENFAEEKPWIHLDIAGTAWLDKPRFEYQSKGGTGAGVTSLFHLCRLLADK